MGRTVFPVQLNRRVRNGADDLSLPVLALLIDAHSVLSRTSRRQCSPPISVQGSRSRSRGNNPLWFRWIVGGEFLFQLPVCIALAFGFAKRRQWVRLPSLNPAYGMARTSSPMSKPRPLWPTRAAQAADWPRLAKARGSLRHGLALRAASGEPAGRRRSQLGSRHRSSRPWFPSWVSSAPTRGRASRASSSTPYGCSFP